MTFVLPRRLMAMAVLVLVAVVAATVIPAGVVSAMETAPADAVGVGPGVCGELASARNGLDEGSGRGSGPVFGLVGSAETPVSVAAGGGVACCYTYANGSPLNYSDPSGYFVHDKIRDAVIGAAKTATGAFGGGSSGGSGGGADDGGGLGGVTANLAVDGYTPENVRGFVGAYLGALEDGGTGDFTLISPQCSADEFAVQSYTAGNYGRPSGPPGCAQSVVADLPDYLAQQQEDRQLSSLAEMGPFLDSWLYGLLAKDGIDCIDDPSVSMACGTTALGAFAGPLSKLGSAAVKGLRGIRYLDEAADIAARGGDEVAGLTDNVADDVLAKVDDVDPSETAQVLTNQRAGNAAADSIAARFPGSTREVSLQATSGRRVVDVLTDSGLAIESKVGRTSLTTTTRRQIARDVELLADTSSPVSSVQWEFFTSPTTGRGGPTGPLAQALDDAGIPFVVNP